MLKLALDKRNEIEILIVEHASNASRGFSPNGFSCEAMHNNPQ